MIDQPDHVRAEQASRMLTTLLATEPFQADRVKQCIGLHGRRHLLKIVPDASELLEPVVVRKMLRRLVGVCVFPDQLCTIGLSIIELPNAFERYLGLVTSTFADVIGLEYPDTTTAILTQKLADLDPQSPWVDVLTSIVAHLKSNRIWDGLPECKELDLSAEAAATYRSHRRREQREIHEAAEQKSVFAQLSLQLHLKYGRSIATRMGERFGAVTELQHHSIQIELPRSERVDPLAGQLRRLTFIQDGDT
ncbi:hypothetical protein [Ramlibacter sp. WS9]|uniref:hypothetical protein n=1 Tax=Ramlibacter sp. WS9 TaxID=1882741 RepID=UPI0011436FCA|nr:hypothetical protein [Ramlibacter sp. WS9]ROZ77592.1 hypothetical protein EEB15_09110 [Ramlibacter sp. WS9]